MVEIKKHIAGETVKGLAAAFMGALITYTGSLLVNNEIEYKVGSRDSFLYSPLGENGLTFAYNGHPLKDISAVEFVFFNKTNKQFNDVDLIFSYQNPNEQFHLVSSGISAPPDIPSSDIIEQLPTEDRNSKRYKLKIFPRQKNDEFFRALFVFEGTKSPTISVSSLSRDAQISEHSKTKDNIIVVLAVLSIILAGAILAVIAGSLGEYFYAPNQFKRNVEKYSKHVEKMKDSYKTENTVNDTIKYYIEFIRPKESWLWSRVFGKQKWPF